MPRIPELELAVSATTRERREGEEEGREYYFVSDAEFRRMLAADEFLEHVDFEWGQRVGTLWSEITRIRMKGKAPLLDLETDGALAVKRRIPDSVTIFVRAPTFAELERRLRARATETGGRPDYPPDAAAALGPSVLRRYSGTSRSRICNTRSSRRERAFASNSSTERASIA